MKSTCMTDICVIGAGSAGLVVAAVAAQMGARVVLIERDKMGGECLNTGCVPSKALLAAAKRAEQCRTADLFGIDSCEPEVDYAKVAAHVADVIAQIEPHDSVERFENFGVQIVKGHARFVNHKTVQANDQTITAKKFVIATGSRPAIPNIPGIDEIEYFTNETIFKLAEKPSHLIVLGGGPVGCELAQAHRLLGTEVTMLVRSFILSKDDADAVDVLRQRLLANGINIREETNVKALSEASDGTQVAIEQHGQESILNASHILIATGRAPTVSELDLEKAGIQYSKRGIAVDARLRTSNKHIFAVGDVVGGYLFTHAASYHAGIVIRNILFRLPAKVHYHALPWVTYTEPELAHVGLTHAEAEKKNITYKTLCFDYADNDRAVAERATVGFIKLKLSPKGQVLGVTIVGESAGELITVWTLVVSKKLKLSEVAGVIVPYPTLSEISKRVAGEYYAKKLYSEKIKKIVRWLLWF